MLQSLVQTKNGLRFRKHLCPFSWSNEWKTRSKALIKKQRALYIFVGKLLSPVKHSSHRDAKMARVIANSIPVLFKNWWFSAGFDLLELQRHETFEKPWVKFSLMWQRFQFWVKLLKKKNQQSSHQQLLSFFNQKHVIFLGTFLKHQKGEEVDIVS